MIRDGDESNVLILCLDPISINSVFDELRVSLLAISHSLTFVIRSSLSLLSISGILFAANDR